MSSPTHESQTRGLLPTEHVELILTDYPESDWVFRQLPLSVINHMSQQRPGDNDKQGQITRSLELGMINPINVAVISEELFAEYVDFTNHVWGAQRQLSEFTPIPNSHFSSAYILLIAGHSRYKGHSDIASRNNVGLDDYCIDARVHTVQSMGDVVAIQLSENIHSAPPPDRAARAYAEAFILDRESTPGLTKKAFAAEHKIPIEALNDALWYVKLPPPIRAMTDNGGLPFSISVELARALGPISEEVTNSILQMSDENPDLDYLATRHEELVFYELARLITSFNIKRSITGTRAKIRQYANALRDRHKERKTNSDIALQLFDGRTYTDRKHYLVDQIKKNLEEFQMSRTSQAIRLHQNAVELLGFDGLAVEESIEQAARALGAVAISA